MVGIVDYGVGNLFSLRCSFGAIGQQATVSSDPAVLAACDRVVLPGVGAFGDAAQKLRDTGLDKVTVSLAAAGVPLLGICLGMQLLFEESLEHGRHVGLNLLPGRVLPIVPSDPKKYKIPHIGWNGLAFPAGKRSPLFVRTKPVDEVYFVHSYAAEPGDCVSAYTEYGQPVVAAAERDNVFGVQFHPEKSGPVGLDILRSFCEIPRKAGVL